MPIGTGIIYNVGDLILSQVSGSGTSFLETKIAAATSSIVYFDSTARINSASLNSITVGTASYVSGSRSIITNLTASNISASGTGSFGMVGIGTTSPAAKLDVSANAVDIAIFRSSGGLANDKRLTITSGGEKVIFNVSDNSNTAIARAYEFQNAGTASMTLNSTGSLQVANTGRILGVLRLQITPQTTFYDNTFAVNSDGGGANGFIYTSGTGGTFPLNTYGELILQSCPRTGYNNGISLVTGTTSPSVKLRIAEDGNVGIGTTSPASKLHISGSGQTIMRLDSDTTSSVSQFQIKAASDAVLIMGMFGGSAASTNFGVTAAGQAYFGTSTLGSPHPTSLVIGNASNIPIAFSTNNVERMRIDSGGAVGIGTTTVSRTLHAYITTGPVMRLQSSGSNASIEFIPSIGHNKYNWLIGAQQNISDAFEITPSTATNGTTFSTPAVLVASSGNVGIGTTSPTQRLDLSGSLRIRSAGTYSDPADNAGFINYDSTGGIFTLSARSNGGNTYMAFRTSNAGTAGEKMRIINDGNVGIGTSSPAVNLEVVGASETLGTIRISGGKVNVLAEGEINSALEFAQRDASVAGLVSGKIASISEFSNGAYAGLGFYTAQQSRVPELKEAVRIKYDGNVGIGTTVPAYLLDVSGSSRHGYQTTDTHQFTGSVSVSGSVTAASFTGSLSGSITSALTASYLTPANSYTITNLTASNISASGTGSFGIVGIGTTSFAYSTANRGVVEIYGSTDGLLALRNSTGNLYIQKTTTDVYINNESNGFIVISNNGSERWRITSAGILQSNGAQTIQTSTGNLTLATNAANGHILLSPNGSGNVGIGTTNPTNELHIYKLTGPTLNLQAGGTGTDGFKIIKGDSGEAYVYNQGAYGLSIGTNNTQRIYITSTGNVGIGTTSPTGSLHVYKAVGVGETTVATIQEGAGGAAELVFRSGVSGSNRRGALRFFSNEVSTTTAQWVVGASLNQSLGDNSFYFYNSSSTSILTLSQTNVGIGTTNPVAKLQVAGNVSGSSFTSSISNAVGFLGTSSWAQNVVSASFATTAQTANALNTGNSYTVGSLTSTTQIGGTTGTIWSQITPGIYSNGLSTGNAIAITSNTTFANQGAWANLGLHQTTANANDLTAKVYLAIGGWYQNSGTGLPVYIGGGYTSNSSSVLSVVPVDTAGNGNVGIGTSSPAAKLEISGSSNSVLLNIKSAISGAILYVSGSGAVGIGTSNVGAYTLQVSGSFAATTKSFVIEHPTKAGKKLIYGSLESPYHGIRLTGRDTLVNGKCKIQLPDYIYKLILHDSVNIQLTGIKCNKTLYIDDINIPENYFTIAYDKTVFESYKDYEFFWDFTAIRADVPELITEV